jgi:OOP family OmpA-OmpF porin
MLPATAFADRAPPPREFTLEDNRLVLPFPITFEAGTANLTPAAARGINHIARYLADKTYISTLRIEGHVASDTDAQALSEKRALAVTRALVAQGVECARLLPVGFGDNKPVADPSTPEGRAENTRITPVNAGLRGRPIGGMPLDGSGRIAGDPCAK